MAKAKSTNNLPAASKLKSPAAAAKPVIKGALKGAVKGAVKGAMKGAMKSIKSKKY
jgi:hypothetical protein